MTLKKYEIKVTDYQYWQEIHDLLCTSTSCEHIPDREVSCYDEKEHSATRGTFILHGSEANSLKNHPYVEWVELDPTENPEEYPKPSHYIKRWSKEVKVYRDLNAGNQPVSTGATIGELDRTGWQIIRTGIKTNGDFWGTVTGNPPVELSDSSYSLTGKNVDVIIHDSGVLQYHPEFLDENVQSRVRDIVLDGPYYIDPDYFILNELIYIKPDGRTGIATTAAHNWWSNSSLRSVGFSTIGTVTINSGYTESRALGNSLDGTNEMTSGHGTSSASLVAGKNFGVAFEANIWNMSGIGEPATMNISIEQNYDLMKLFHLYKPINPVTGRKNPTIVNGSWGYQAAFASGDTVDYRFRGVVGSFLGDASVTDQATAMKSGLNNQVSGARESWSSSSRSNSTDTAANEMMSTGVIYVAAAGNNNQRLGIGSADPDRLNYMSDTWFGTTDPRAEFPAGTVPCNHRDWMNPQGIGFDSVNDFHPVICVGAMDEFIETINLSERKADYSNNGPGIDVWSPADETLAAGTNGVINYTDYERYDDSRFYDNYFNGTSAAAPVACGVLALYLQTNPSASSKEVKRWLFKHGSVIVDDTQYLDVQPDDTATTYWTNSFNMRGAQKRIIYNPFANDVKPSLSNMPVSGIKFSVT
jgi:hypothetical protein